MKKMKFHILRQFNRPINKPFNVVWCAALGVTVAIAACTSQNSPPSPEQPSSSPPPTSETPPPDSPNALDPTAWTMLLPGEATADLAFTDNAELTLRDQVILTKIPVSYSSDHSETAATYAARLMVSPASPSGRYTIVKACDDPNPEMGLCWAIYAIDREETAAQRVSIGKYGGLDWVQWAPDERYAVFIEKMEGSSWFIGLDLDSGESQLMDELPAEPDLSQFTWEGDRTFSVPLADGSRVDADIETLF